VFFSEKVFLPQGHKDAIIVKNIFILM